MTTQDAILSAYLSMIDNDVSNAMMESQLYKEQLGQEYALFAADQMALFSCDPTCASKCTFNAWIGGQDITTCTADCGCSTDMPEMVENVETDYKISLANFDNTNDEVALSCRTYCANACINAGGSGISDCVDSCGCIWTGEGQF